MQGDRYDQIGQRQPVCLNGVDQQTGQEATVMQFDGEFECTDKAGYGVAVGEWCVTAIEWWRTLQAAPAYL